MKLAFCLESLRDIFFPRKCIVCKETLALGECHLCYDCFRKMPLTYFWEWRDNPAWEKISEKTDLEDAASLFFYRSTSGFKFIPQSVKYGGDKLLGYRLGFILGHYMYGKEWYAGIDAVTPVPLHPLRRFHRGYNQAEVIARGVADGLGVPLVCGLIRRRRYTRTQTRLNVPAKIKNVAGAFSSNPAMIQKMLDHGVGHILIVDDVLTTGATLSECAAALSEHFRISVATLSFVG